MRKVMYMPRVLFFRSELLPLSETFIAGQAAVLTRYEPWFAGVKCIRHGLELDASRLIVSSKRDILFGKISRRIYYRTGFAPGFQSRIQSTAPDLIHAHFAMDAAVALPVQRRLDVPLMATLYGYDVTSNVAALQQSTAGRTYLRRRHELWQRTQVFVCISEFIRRKAIEAGFPEDRLWVHPIGIDVDFFHPGSQRAQEPLVLFVGRLVEKKGVAYLVRSMKRVQEQLPEARLVVLGDGPLRACLEAEARSTLRQCEFLGAQPADAVRQWMRKAAVIAAPSVIAANGDAEGLCMVVCEAQSMEIPVVSFQGPGISESVADGETGFLVPQRDEGALADAILTLLHDESLAARMGAAGRRRVERLFNVHCQAAVLEEKYDQLLGNIRSVAAEQSNAMVTAG